MGSGASTLDNKEAQIHNNPLIDVILKKSDYLRLHKKIEQVIRDHGEYLLNDSDFNGLRPLYYVAEQEDEGLFNFLIEKGARVDELSCYNNYEHACGMLHQAVLNEELKLVKFLVNNGANINLADASGTPPLHLAIKSEGEDSQGTFPITSYLLDNGCDINPQEAIDDLIADIANETAKEEIRALVSKRRGSDENMRNIDEARLTTNPLHRGSAVDDDPSVTMSPIHAAPTSKLQQGNNSHNTTV